jgi:nicotinate phosphoribosyltransferase
VDTYDTLKSGVPTAIKVAKELGNNINFAGIRLDSGDLAYLSKEARRLVPNSKTGWSPAACLIREALVAMRV